MYAWLPTIKKTIKLRSLSNLKMVEMQGTLSMPF